MEVEVSQDSIANHWTDRFGSVASPLCAIHCALCGFLPAAFTTLGAGFLLGHEAEWIFSITAMVLGLGALILGWRQHRSTGVAVLLALGIVGILSSRLIEMSGGHEDEPAAESAEAEAHHEDHHDEHGEDELAHKAGTTVGVMAGFLLLFGHISNMRASRRCREECCDVQNDSTLKPIPLNRSNSSDGPQ